ncbi:MAG: polyvinylalcohol dehydrogenase [Planctomycetes bacterium]|nr:polyvinylalcohol dehydrogenase [Planctomycetota bacterium]
MGGGRAGELGVWSEVSMIASFGAGRVARLAAGLVVGWIVAMPLPAAAADTDWPQFGGPKRDNRSTAEGLAREWPESGPPLLGTARNLGIGYASVAVADGAVLTMGSRGDDELVICLDEQTLAERWATKIGATRPDGMGAGPRGTPTIAGDAVYALGANGDLACLALADGRVRWAGNVLTNSGGSNITWGISESPLVDGGRVIVTPGGPGATMVAVDAKSGRLVWKAAVPGNPAAAYSSIIVVETGGLKQYVNFVHTGVIGVRADTGQFLWGNDSSANGTANCSSPVAWQGNVFSASGYGKGGALVRLAGDRRGVAASLAYATKDLKSHHGGLVVDGDFVYGTDEGLLTCLDLRTGRVAWQNRSVGKGALVWADGLLVLRSEDGPVALVECSPRGYVEKGRFTPADRSDRPAWPHPVIANGKLWLRDQEGMAVYRVDE